jgi:hypothetical protein
MQKPLHQLNQGDRRLVRKWRLANVGFYGSILAGLVLYAALHAKEVNLAAARHQPEAMIFNP